MLFNFEWLQAGKNFPPEREMPRIVRYRQNAMLFDGDHFADPVFRTHDSHGCERGVGVYLKCAERISRVIGNFDDVISFPVLLNYQRLMSLKMADLVCGEHPTISGASAEENATIKDLRDSSDFDAKLYSTVIDISRYGDAIWRIYKDWDDQYNFTCWDPTQWYPVVRQDGTNSIEAHCLCWRENKSKDIDNPDWYLHVQIHRTASEQTGYYEERTYKMASNGQTILDQISSARVRTGLDRCAVMHIRAFATTNSVYGYDDYMPLDSLLAEIMTRVSQISGILDKHADPNITGPASMLSINPSTGEYFLKTGKFFAVSQGEEQPKYMTWDGQLSSAFSQLEFLVNQLYILSEMGAALLGGGGDNGQAISGTAMRFKMVNPLAKARRIANSLTRPVRQLLVSLSLNSVEYKNVSVFWSDGLPDDPRENVEICKLATGATQMMPLEKAIMEYFSRSNDEAKQWIQQIREESAASQPQEDPNHPGPQDGTGVNPSEKGSTTGLKNFKSSTNMEDGK